MSSSTRFLAVLAVARLVAAQAAHGGSTGGNATAAGAEGGRTGGNTTAAGAAGAAAEAAQAMADAWNKDFESYIFIVLASLIVSLGVWRVGMESIKYVRTLTSLNNDTQRYFAVASPAWAFFKKNILYAPVFRKRHNREFQLSSAINVGTLPTRFELFFLLGYFGTNVAFCVVSIQWNGTYSDVCQQLRNRTGVLAVVNMIPVSPIVRRVTG
jgi:hypothetical protein